MMFALYKDNKRISRYHANKYVCYIEAYERNLIWHASPDFIGDKAYKYIVDGVEVKHIKDILNE